MRLALIVHLLVVAEARICNSCGASRRAVVGVAAASLGLPAAARPPPAPVQVTDRNGATVTAAAWVEAASMRPDLVLGLDGEPYFLLVRDGRLLDYALRAECTHLGCLVQPDAFGSGFACPCHGSNYAADGAVTRGPAPRSLGIAKVTEDEKGLVVMSAWEGADPRAA